MYILKLEFKRETRPRTELYRIHVCYESLRFRLRYLSQIQIWTLAIVKSWVSYHLLLFSSWYFLVDTHDLTIAGVQIWIWDKYLNLNLRLRWSKDPHILTEKSSYGPDNRSNRTWIGLQRASRQRKIINRRSIDKSYTGRERLIRSHSSARFCFELSGNSN